MDVEGVVEYDPETKSYTGTVPGLPVVVDAKSKRSAIRMLRDAVMFYFEDVQSTGAKAAKPGHAELVKIKV